MRLEIFISGTNYLPEKKSLTLEFDSKVLHLELKWKDKIVQPDCQEFIFDELEPPLVEQKVDESQDSDSDSEVSDSE